MKAIAEIRLLPVNGNDASVQADLERARDILVASGLEVAMHAQSTEIEGELEDVFDMLKRLHVYLDHCNAVRLSTVVRLQNEQERGVPATSRLGWTREQSHGARPHETSEACQVSEMSETSGGICTAGSDSFVTVWQIASPLS